MAFSNNLSKIGLKIGQAAKGGGKAVSNKAQIKKPFVDVKDKNGEIQKTIGNIYTGKKVNPLYVGGAGALWLGGKNASSGLTANTIGPLQLATKNDYQEYGSPDVLMYDGVGQEKAPSNMNADGSLVFGLHNMRKG